MLNYGIFALLLSLDTNYLAASAIGYASGIAVSFLINRKIVFRSSSRAKGQLVRYFVAYGLALGAQLVLLEVLVRLDVDVLVANAVAIVVVLIANFFLVRGWVFGTR